MTEQLIEFNTEVLVKEKGLDIPTLNHHFSGAMRRSQRLGSSYKEFDLTKNLRNN